MAKVISGIFARTIPLKRNINDGMIERDKALSIPSEFPQITQKAI